MTVAADGNPYILYNNTEHDRGLWLAHCDDGACTGSQRSLINSHTGFNRFDIAVGTDALPIMAVVDFQPNGRFQLTALHCTDPACTSGIRTAIQTWEDPFDTRGFPSVAVGSDGLPIIAYNDLTVTNEGAPNEVHDESLKLAHCNNLACTSSQITKIALGGTDFVSVDIGGDGLPFVAYRADGVLNVAHCKDATCTSATIVTVDPGPGVGMFTSLATDPFGMPMIAYFDGVNHDLKVARLGS
jgi:hypothetical protein